MNYKTDFGIWSGIFAVPSSVVDEHLRLAGAAQLKALLYCLRHSQKSVSDEELSGALGISKADAADAVQYWVHAGVLSRGDDKTALQAVRTGAGIIPSDSAENNMIVGSEDMRRVSAAAEGAERALSAAQKHIPAPNVRPTGPEVNRRATEDPEVSYLLQEAQLRLSRMISPGESSTLVYLHDYYGLPSEVILLAMELAAKRGR